MEYQELISSYKDKKINIENLSRDLKNIYLLTSRERYRILDMNNNTVNFSIDTKNVLNINEIPSKKKMIIDNINSILDSSFEELVKSITYCRAWKFLGIDSEKYSIKNFKNQEIENKFIAILNFNKLYSNFLKYQKISDIIPYFSISSKLNEQDIYKVQFLLDMFDLIDNYNIKKELFCLDKKFLIIILGFQKSKIIRMEDYIKTKSASIQEDYFNRYSRFFSTEDFRDISENIKIASKTLKFSTSKIIDIYYQISETIAEQAYLEDEYKIILDLKNKFYRVIELKENQTTEEELKEVKEESKEEIKQEDKNTVEDPKTDYELLNNIDNENDANLENQRNIENLENQNNETLNSNNYENEEEKSDNKIEKEKLEKENRVLKDSVNISKEKVIPIVLSWFDRTDITLTRKISLNKLVEFFDKIKEMQKQENKRAILFLITNTDKEVTLKRVQEIKKRARTNDLDGLFEGAFGGYSSFKINADEKIVDISVMSDVNRKKITTLLEIPKDIYLMKNTINEGCESFLRYDIGIKENQNQYLNAYIKKLQNIDIIKNQPILFLPYIENKSSGIDVLLKSQLKAISQLTEYFNYKYDISDSKIIKINVEKMSTNIDF